MKPRARTQPDGMPWAHEGKQPHRSIVEHGRPMRTVETPPVPRWHDTPATAQGGPRPYDPPSAAEQRRVR